MALLDASPEVVRTAADLILRAVNYPEKSPMLRNRKAVRVVASQRQVGMPPLRFFYSIDEETIYLLLIEVYDDIV